MYMNAMDVLIDSNGEASIFLLPEGEGTTMPPQWVVGMFIGVEFCIANNSTLDMVRDLFIFTLRRIRR